MYFEEELDSPFNKISSYIHEKLSGKIGEVKLRDITHIIDCECYQIEGVRIFREVSILDLETLTYELLHCFAEDFCSYREMSEKNKFVVRRIRSIHGLNFYNYRVKNHFLSQKELISYLKKKYYIKDVLFGYKGGNIESCLCRDIKIPALNIEHFGVEKYDFLLWYFNKPVLTCCEHISHFTTHCSLYETLLFAARICEKIGEIEKLEKILELYNKKCQ